ncbi:MAG: arylsulfatase [Bacteroidales bacterium]
MNSGYAFCSLAITGLMIQPGCSPRDEVRKKDDSRHPNIIVILADDLGFGDLSCYGSTQLRTPNIDRLAQSGLRFTNGYCSSATSTPSRFALLTGSYPWRNQRARVLPGDAPLLIDTSLTTLPGMLRSAGYATGIVGKWHLGLGNGQVDWNRRVGPGPNEVGFDYSFIMAATNDRCPTVYLEDGRVVGLDPDDPIEVSYRENFPGEPTGREHPESIRMGLTHGHDGTIVNGISRIGFMRGGARARWVDEEMAGVFLEKAVEYVESNAERPFFLYFALHQPHVPRVPSPEFEGRSGLGPRGDVILEADWMVGELLKSIDRLGIGKRTIILFTSDNGPVLDDGYADLAVELNGGHTPAGILRGGKYSLFDGGTHVPFIISWPGRINPGVSGALVSQVDLAATFAQMTGQPNPGPDSENLLDALMGQSEIGRTQLILENGSGRTTLRSERWVLIPSYPGTPLFRLVNIESGFLGEPQLYDLVEDPAQKNNLAPALPEQVTELTQALLMQTTEKQQ